MGPWEDSADTIAFCLSGEYEGDIEALKQAAAPPHSVWPTITTVKNRPRWVAEKRNLGWDELVAIGNRESTVFYAKMVHCISENRQSAIIVKVELAIRSRISSEW